MESEIKEMLHNPKYLYSAAIVISIFFAITLVDLYGAIEHNKNLVDFSNIEIDISKGISAEEFKYNIFVMGIQEDLNKGISPEAIRMKFKYFYGVDLR